MCESVKAMENVFDGLSCSYFSDTHFWRAGVRGTLLLHLWHSFPINLGLRKMKQWSLFVIARWQKMCMMVVDRSNIDSAVSGMKTDSFSYVMADWSGRADWSKCGKCSGQAGEQELREGMPAVGRGSGVLSLLSRISFCGSTVCVAAEWRTELLICVTSCEIHCSNASF